jgi:MFS family permease
MNPDLTTRWLLFALSLTMLLSSLGTSIANVGLPTLKLAFGATFAQVQWVVLAYLASITLLVAGAGRLGDHIGRRRLLLGGISLFTLASALCSAAPGLPLLIAARALQGIGAAAMMALTMAFVAGSVSKEKTGGAMGLLATMSAVGTALGPTLGGALIAFFGWRAIFAVTIPLGLAALMLAWRFLPPDQPHSPIQATPPPPLNLRAKLAANLLVTAVVMGTLVVGPFYLSGALLLDPAGIGMVMSCGPIVSALAGAPSGRLVDRFGAAPMGVAGLACMAAGTAGLALAPWPTVVAYAVPLTVLTAGYALFQAANNTAAMLLAAPSQRGGVSGLLGLSRNLGLVSGTLLLGAVFAQAAEKINPVTGMKLAFGAGLILVLAALVITRASRAFSGKSSITT